MLTESQKYIAPASFCIGRVKEHLRDMVEIVPEDNMVFNYQCKVDTGFLRRPLAFDQVMMGSSQSNDVLFTEP